MHFKYNQHSPIVRYELHMLSDGSTFIGIEGVEEEEETTTSKTKN